MNQSSTTHSGQTNPLVEAVRNLDRSLSYPDKLRSKKKLELFHAQHLLQQVEQFFEQAQKQQTQNEVETPEFKTLLAAGCRLSSDLNENVLTRLVDQAQNQDEQILTLSRQLVRQLIARAQTGQLLRKAQTLKQHTVDTAETAGLGIII